MSVFTETTGLVEFMQEKGFASVELLHNTKTDSRFVSFNKGKLTARVANNVEAITRDLARDLAISWFTPEDGDSPSFMLHLRGESSAEVLSTFSLEEEPAKEVAIDKV